MSDEIEPQIQPQEPFASSSKTPVVPDVTWKEPPKPTGPAQWPKTDPGNNFKLESTDDYHMCYHRLRPHIAYQLEFNRINKDWVPKEKVDEFEKIFDEWLLGIEKKNPPGSVKEFIGKKGHKEVEGIWKRYLPLKQGLIDEAKKRLAEAGVKPKEEAAASAPTM